jgi:hypothetical protein
LNSGFQVSWRVENKGWRIKVKGLTRQPLPFTL